MKRVLAKKIGRALLQYHQLEDVLLDLQRFMNNRPLCYYGEEFDQTALTPSILLRGSPADYLAKKKTKKKTKKKSSIKCVQEEWVIYADAVNSLEKDGKTNTLKHCKRDIKIRRLWTNITRN